MRLSEAQRGAMYSAICEPIIDMRVRRERGEPIGDADLHRLQHNIWNRLLEVLANMEVPT